VSDTWPTADVVISQWYRGRPFSVIMDAFADHGSGSEPLGLRGSR
jgi:hypothetical protein